MSYLDKCFLFYKNLQVLIKRSRFLANSATTIFFTLLFKYCLYSNVLVTIPLQPMRFTLFTIQCVGHDTLCLRGVHALNNTHAGKKDELTY